MPPFKSNTYSDYITIVRSILENRKCQKISILIHAENWGRYESVFVPMRLNFEPNPSHAHKGARGRDISVCLILFCGLSAWLDRARERAGTGRLCLLKQQNGQVQLHGAAALLFNTAVVTDVKILKRKCMG